MVSVDEGDQRFDEPLGSQLVGHGGEALDLVFSWHGLLAIPKRRGLARHLLDDLDLLATQYDKAT